MRRLYDVKEIERSYKMLRAIRHPIRQQIISLILENDTPLDVSTIYITLGLDQTWASSQLRIMREAGLLNVERAGRNMLYSVNPKAFRCLSAGCKILNRISITDS